MTASEFWAEWYHHFARNVDEKFMQNHVYAKGCFPWHIFSFDMVEHIYTEDEVIPDRLWELLENSEYYVLQGWDFMDAKVEKSSKIKDIKMFGLLMPMTANLGWHIHVRSHSRNLPLFPI